MTFQQLSESQRESLKQAVSRYHNQLSGSAGEEYLAQRGLANLEGIEKFRLGYVADPLPEHEKYTGCLVIPYMRRHPRHGWSCVSLRFRSIDGEGPKYLTMPGDRPRLYNTFALTQPTMKVGIAEGEIDAITATLCGLPTVGVPGAQSWQSHWAELFRGYETVYMLADGDDAGYKMARRLAKELPNLKVVPSPDGEDVNSTLTNHGVEAVRERFK